MTDVFREAINRMPIVSILRGVDPEEVIDIVDCLFELGIKIVEVPLNSPSPYKSINLISKKYGDKMIVGAGTVLCQNEVYEVSNIGGSIIVSPNVNTNVIQKTKELGMVSLPGASTPTEVFSALDSGASGIKAFPSDMVSPSVIKSWRAVLPKGLILISVGGVTSQNIQSFWEAGASGFGMASEIYKPGLTVEDIRINTIEIINAYNRICT